MNKRFLVTTALEETIPNDQPLLLLGEWCRPISKLEKLNKLNLTVLPYHWDDREKLHKDFLYLDALYEKLLVELTNKLNEIHGTNHKIKYWRILIGPWLWYFIPIIFDRWSCIQLANNNFQLSGTHTLDMQEHSFIPKGMKDFTKFIVSDEWNHFIYSYIIKNYTNIIYTNTSTEKKFVKIHYAQNLNFKRRIKKYLLDKVNYITNIFTKKNDALFINTYLSTKNIIKLSLKMSQFPSFFDYQDNFNFDEIKVKKNNRKWKLNGINKNDFEVFARSIIPKQIPILYLEGYNYLLKKVNNLPWPSEPKIIFTSNSYNTDDNFKLYAANKNEQGVPLVIGQHGGGIGTHLFAFYEKHQIDISDLYLTWGWKDPSKSKVKQVGMLKDKKPLVLKPKLQNKILMIALNMPFHSNHIYSSPISSQVLYYFNDQCKFIDKLDFEVKNKLTIRLKYVEKNFEPSLKRWKDKFPKIKIDEGATDLYKLFKQSKIFVSTYNATTFLESLSMNIPTIIFWDTKYWEITKSAEKYFDQLKKVGIFHDNPESAARHINKIWNNVDLWWDSKEVKVAVETFKNYYCYKPKKLVEKIYTELQNVIKTSNNDKS